MDDTPFRRKYKNGGEAWIFPVNDQPWVDKRRGVFKEVSLLYHGLLPCFTAASARPYDGPMKLGGRVG